MQLADQQAENDLIADKARDRDANEAAQTLLHRAGGVAEAQVAVSHEADGKSHTKGQKVGDFGQNAWKKPLDAEINHQMGDARCCSDAKKPETGTHQRGVTSAVTAVRDASPVPRRELSR